MTFGLLRAVVGKEQLSLAPLWPTLFHKCTNTVFFETKKLTGNGAPRECNKKIKINRAGVKQTR
jgi:hypothetical protein